MPPQTPAGWFPDPFGRHERRYWDGRQWTHHVASRGRHGVDPAGTAPARAGWFPDPYRPHEQRYWDGDQWTHHVASREAALLGEPELVVNQKAKIFGSRVEYVIKNQHGAQVGLVQEMDRDLIDVMVDKAVRKAKGRRIPTAETRTYKLQVIDMSGRVVLSMKRPATGGKSHMVVYGSSGFPIGRIAQENYGVGGSLATLAHAGLTGWSRRLDSAVQGWDEIGHVRFRIEAGPQVLGTVRAMSTKERHFTIGDADDAEIGRITQSWAGWTKERFTRADDYVLQVDRPLDEPLRSLVVAAAIMIDIALKQGDPSRRWNR
jgi:hypothetical protein